MNDVQLWIAAGLPIITALVGILLNQTALARVEKRVDSLESRLGGRIDSLEAREEAHYQSVTADLRRFYQFIGEYGARIESLENRAG